MTASHLKTLVALNDMWASGESLLTRFGITPDNLPAHGQYEKVKEEVREVGMELDALTHTADPEARARLIAEIADVLVTLNNLMWVLQVTDEEAQIAFNAVTVKNDAKTHDTHELDAIRKTVKRKNAV